MKYVLAIGINIFMIALCVFLLHTYDVHAVKANDLNKDVNLSTSVGNAIINSNNTSKLKKDAVSTVGGVNVVCEYSNGLLTEREHFDYKDFNIETVKAAYAEAGADVIEYEYGYDFHYNLKFLLADFFLFLL